MVMNKIRLEPLKKNKAKDIETLLKAYDFKDYRNYPFFSEKDIIKYLTKQISELIRNEKTNQIIVAKNKRRILGLASFLNLAWDTKLFGVKMAKIGHLVTVGSNKEKAEIAGKLLEGIFQIRKKEKVVFLSCRVDTEDLACLHALEEKGFKIMDTLVTYIFVKPIHKLPEMRRLYSMRPYRESDFDILINLAKKSFSKGRFHMDLFIPKEAADRFHAEWLKNCLTGKMADDISVAVHKGKPVGFLAYKQNRELSEIMKVRFLGRGIAAVLPQAKGAIITLFRDTINKWLTSSDKIVLGEFETQITYYAMIKILKRLGMDYVASKHTFHRWFSSPSTK